MQPAAETGHRLALLVATSAYSDPDLRQLRAPGHDADQLAAVLRNPQIGGFDVQVLINPASGKVQEGIEDFCTDRHPDDQLLIYLSCHGVLDSYGRLYYATANTRRQRLAATAVAAAWLNERLEDCRARRQILILDCCHSGAFAKGAKGDADLALQHRFEPHGRGRVVLTASRSTEYSFEGGQASGEGVPSVFTHAIVHGLRTGDADRDKDGLITVTDLYQYVYDNVRAAEPRQTPELWTYGAEGNLLVAHSVRGAVIEPEPLPEDLRVTLESPRRRVRETGVGELADLLDGSGPGLVLAARQALERIAEEDHPQVAALARIATSAPAGTAADQVRRELTDRAHREELERQEAARREAEEKARREAEEKARREAEEKARREAEEAAVQRRRRQIEQLQREICERAAAQDWDAVVAASGELAALDPAAADPDGLASAAREQITRRQEAERVTVAAQQPADPPLTEPGELLGGTADAQAPTPADEAGAEPVVGTAASSGDVRHRAVSTAGDSHLPLTEDVPAPGPSKKTTPAARLRLAGHAIPRRLVIIAAAVSVVIISGVVSIIIITTGTNRVFGPASSRYWAYTTGGYVIGSPAVMGGTVYVGSEDDKVYALDAATGHVRWTYTTGRGVGASPAVADGTVYVSSTDHKVYALDAATGHVRWTYPTGLVVGSSLSLSSPAVAGGTVYFGSGESKVYALDAATGHVRWTHTTGTLVLSSPAVAGGTVYVGSWDGNVYALDTATGHVRWTYTTGGTVYSSPAVADGTVYVGSTDHNVYVLDAATGHVRWTYTTGGWVTSSPAMVGGTVYIGSWDWTIYALKAAGS